MNTEFGLAHLWAQGDFVARFVALLLLGMSLASWMVILIKAIDLRRYAQQARSIESFWHAADFADGLSKLGTDPANPSAPWRWKAARRQPTTTPRRNCTIPSAPANG